MAINVPTPDEVHRAFEQAVTLPELTPRRDIARELGGLLATVAAPEWQQADASKNVRFLDVDNQHRLIRIVFRHVVQRNRTYEARRLKAALGEVGMALRQTIPQGSSGGIQLTCPAEEEKPSGTKHECLAQGVVRLSIPPDILEFLKSRRLWALSGRQTGSGTGDMVLAEQARNRIDDYDMWVIDVRSTDEPRRASRRVLVERPTKADLPYRITDLDD